MNFMRPLPDQHVASLLSEQRHLLPETQQPEGAQAISEGRRSQAETLCEERSHPLAPRCARIKCYRRKAKGWVSLRHNDVTERF